MRIIPAIDIIEGKCVRLTQGDYATQRIYSANPLEIAKMFEDNGMQYLHLVDLDGARSRQGVNYRILEILASKTNLDIDFGGGINSIQDVKTAFDAGAKQITVGSIAAQEPALMLEWLIQFGPEKIILGADCKNGKIATNGWTKDSGLDVIAFIREYEEKNVQYSIVTDIGRDGMLAGPSFELYVKILSDTRTRLIASGGITTIEDVLKLKETGCEGAIIGKAIYEGTINLEQLKALC